MCRRLYVFMDMHICMVFSVLFMLSYECDYNLTTAVSILYDGKLRMYATLLVIVS
jgi:hypothetical protein